MADENDDPPFAERPQLFCQLFVPCHTVWYDVTNPDAGYSLGRMICVVTSRMSYPLQFPRLFGYARLYGDAGAYSLRILLVEIERGEDGDETQKLLGEYGEFGTFGPWRLERFPDDFMNEYCFPLEQVTFPAAGVYEFQLWQDDDGGEHALLFSVRVWAKEQP